MSLNKHENDEAMSKSSQEDLYTEIMSDVNICDDLCKEYSGAPIVSEPCWLCDYCMNELACTLNTFIDEKIAQIYLPNLCDQIHEVIHEAYPGAIGASTNDISKHITLHMINANVKISSTIRTMSGISDAIRQNIFKRDEEAGNVVLDKVSAELYLKFVNQIITLYKVDGSKSLFGAVKTSKANVSMDNFSMKTDSM